MPQVQNSSDVMELKGLRRKVFFNWTRGFAEDPELKVILAAHKANTAVHHKRQVAVVRYLIGGPSVMNAEDLARQDAEMATKTDGTVLSPDLVRKAHEMLVDVIRESGCSKDVVDEATQRMLELHEGWKQLAAQPRKKHLCSCCSMQ